MTQITSSVFPEGTTIGAYPRSEWPTSQLPPSGAPPVSAAETADKTNGVADFTTLNAGSFYFAGAQVAGVWRYVSFMEPVAEAAGGAAITSELLLGSDIPLLHSWGTPGPAEADLPGRVYVQGGRAYMAGYLVAPADASQAACVIPPAAALLLMGGAGDDDGQRRFPATANASTPVNIVFAYVGSDFTLTTVLRADGLAVDEGSYINLAPISWPVAP